MSDGQVVWLTLLVLLAVTTVLVGSLVKSILQERRTSHVRKIWANFGLSIAFCALFLVSWAAQGLAEWAVYRQEQHVHGEPIEVTQFFTQFAQSTLENWQSEFLQLFSFVVLAAVLVHKGSAESKDGTDEIKAIVQRIEKRLDARATEAVTGTATARERGEH